MADKYEATFGPFTTEYDAEQEFREHAARSGEVLCPFEDGHAVLTPCDDADCPVCKAGLTPACPECGAVV